MPNNDWDKELSELEIIIPDGAFKDCKVYHDATWSVVKDIVEKNRQDTVREVIEKMQEEVCVADDYVIEAFVDMLIKQLRKEYGIIEE